MRVVLTGAGICSAAGHSLAEVATFFAGSCSPFVSSEAFGLPGYAVCPVSSPDADGLGTDDVAARLRTWRRRACVQRGGRRQFDVPLLFAGTQFQRKVWHALLEIPYGETISYGEMACSLGVPQSVRAVANANGANAISIFAPCHRVIGSKGMLTGYGGGLDAKRYLLDLEKQLTQLD